MNCFSSIMMEYSMLPSRKVKRHEIFLLVASHGLLDYSQAACLLVVGVSEQLPAGSILLYI